MAIDTSKYEARRRTVNNDWSGKKAANEFGRFTSQQRYTRNKGDLTRDFSRSQNPFMGSMAQRGLTGGGVRSGAFQQALSRRVGDYTQAQGRLGEDYANQARSYDMQGAELDRWRTDALAELEAEKAAEIATAALNIKALRPMFGG